MELKKKIRKQWLGNSVKLLFSIAIFCLNSLSSFGGSDSIKLSIGSGFTDGCSGSLVAFKDYKLDHKALYLTNGHCLRFESGEFMLPGQVIRNKSYKKYVGLNWEADNWLGGSRVLKLKTTQILLATMTIRDIAVIELENTYGEIERNQGGILPYIIKAFGKLNPSDKLSYISGFFNTVHQCEFSHVSNDIVMAGIYSWTNTIVSRNCSKPGKPGVSGSPVLEDSTRNIVALVNSSDKGTSSPCSLSDACELDSNANKISEEGDEFFQNINFLYDCRSGEGIFDSQAPNCNFNHI